MKRRFLIGKDVIVRNYYEVVADSLDEAKAMLKADDKTYISSCGSDENIDPNVDTINHDYMIDFTLIEQSDDG